MGDEELEKEELETSEDDLESSGEDEEELESQETAETDEALIDAEGKKTPETIPYARFAEKVKEGEISKTKLDQFKRLGPEGYYQLYPDEKPDDYEPPSKKTPTDITDFRHLKVEGGGKYEGWTFEDVFKHDERAAFQIDPYYAQLLREEKVETERQQKAERDNYLREADEELKVFSKNLSNELFGKTDDLDEKESSKIQDIISDTLDWMGKTGRGGGNIADAYLLMNIDSKLKDKADRTLKTVITTLRNEEPTSISSNKTSPKDTGYMRFLNMTPKQVADELEKLSDQENEEFLKKAPAEIRKKFPDLPWDESE